MSDETMVELTCRATIFETVWHFQVGSKQHGDMYQMMLSNESVYAPNPPRIHVQSLCPYNRDPEYNTNFHLHRLNDVNPERSYKFCPETALAPDTSPLVMPILPC